MNWPDEITEGFPSPHREEPAALRRDIADELADHLACAMEAEIRKGIDVTEARQAVIERFGNPRRLARRLWFDAMKEAIMKDRVIMVGMVVLILAVLALAGMTLRMNNAMIAALQKISTANTQSAIPAGLATATIKVVKGKEGGEAVEGVKVSLDGCAFAEKDIQTLSEKTNKEGLATLGPVRPGPYSLNLIDEEQGLHLASGSFMLYGSRNIEKTIIVPDVPETSATLELVLPDNLKGKPFAVGIELAGIQKDGSWASDCKMVIGGDGALYKYHPNQQTNGGNKYVLDAIEQLRLPSLEYRVHSIAHGILGKEEEAGSGARMKYSPANYKEFGGNGLPVYPGEPVFAAQPGVVNKWKLQLPPEIIAGIEEAAIMASAAKTYLVTKDCMVLAYLPDWNYGDVDNIAIADNDGGVRVLIDWPAIPAEDMRVAGRKFLLALYSRKTTVGTPLPAGMAIGAYEINADWPERTSWKALPAVAKEPALKFDFQQGEGWKVFDITAIVQEQQKTGEASHGIELRFQAEKSSSQNWSGYAFVSREGDKEWTDRRPVLLAVDPE